MSLDSDGYTFTIHPLSQTIASYPLFWRQARELTTECVGFWRCEEDATVSLIVGVEHLLSTGLSDMSSQAALEDGELIDALYERFQAFEDVLAIEYVEDLKSFEVADFIVGHYAFVMDYLPFHYTEVIAAHFATAISWVLVDPQCVRSLAELVDAKPRKASAYISKKLNLRIQYRTVERIQKVLHKAAMSEERMEVLKFLLSGDLTPRGAERLVGLTSAELSDKIRSVRELSIKRDADELIRVSKEDLLGNRFTRATAFFGRTEELALLTKHVLDDRMKVIAISGAPGCGKTRVAHELVRSLGRTHDNIFVVMCDLRDQQSVDDMIRVLAVKLKIKLTKWACPGLVDREKSSMSFLEARG